MESTSAQKKIERDEKRLKWLSLSCRLNETSLIPLPSDASLRRYFRVTTQSDSFILMDAPPPNENCQAFVAVALALRELHLNAPFIYAQDLTQGFLLLTDFGDETYLKALNQQNADQLYGVALKALAGLQRCKKVQGLTIPPFDADFMWKEWAWHKEWFTEKLLHLSLNAKEQEALDQCMAVIIDSALSQPQVFMHRDFHSANLMVLPNNEIGILDFQDAFIGPITYDLVSLLRDCYIDWPDRKVKQWVENFWQLLKEQNGLEVGSPTFSYWFDMMGMQRHLKALLTFARKYVRDNDARYLVHVPRTLHYLQTVSAAYPTLAPLHRYIREYAIPTFNRIITSCAP